MCCRDYTASKILGPNYYLEEDNKLNNYNANTLRAVT